MSKNVSSVETLFWFLGLFFDFSYDKIGIKK